MTPERLAEIEQAATRYGAANCWTGTTGTLAGMIRELLAEVERLETESAKWKWTAACLNAKGSA